MKKYFHVINIGIQNNLTYRFNFLMRTLFGLIPLVAMLYVWRTIYEGKGSGSTVGWDVLSCMALRLLARRGPASRWEAED